MVISAEFNKPEMAVYLSWEPDSNAKEYIIVRKLKEAPKFIDTLAVLNSMAISYIDENVSEGVSYEYGIFRNAEFLYEEGGETKTFYYQGYGYINVGIELEAVEKRGNVLLLVDNTVAPLLQDKLERFKMDLAGDGWGVIAYEVPRAERFNPKAVRNVKELILNTYHRLNTDLRTVVLFGRVPVPYSGNYAIDGHFEDHSGAWPTDVYYGELNGRWTDDSTTYNVTGYEPRIYNIPYDGKFDQTIVPTEIELEVGRIDMLGLKYYEDDENSRSEIDLLEIYLDKNHDYRHKKIQTPHRAIIDDRWGLVTSEAWGANPLSNFTSLLGKSNVETGRIRSKLEEEGYLFLWGGSQGAFNNLWDVAYAHEYAAGNQYGVFTFYFGSLFADWDVRDNMLRSAIASSPSILTSAFMGRPFWFIHHMGLGGTIGYSTIVTQNNFSTYPSTAAEGRRSNHIALIGDPTLRMHIVEPPSSLSAVESGEVINLSWLLPSEIPLGYHIYRSANAYGPYIRLNEEITTENQFADIEPLGGHAVYMVRAIVLEEAASGTYYNLSQGIFASPDGMVAVSDFISKESDLKISPNPASSWVNIEFEGPTNENSKIEIFDLNGTLVKEFNGFTNNVIWDLNNSRGDLALPGIYILRYSDGKISIICKLTVVR